MASPSTAATVGNRSGKIGTGLIALAFVVLFIAFWGGLLWEVFTADAQVELAEHQETILAFLATTVATGTAAVLGINVVSLTSKENADGTTAPEGTPPREGTMTLKAASVATGQALRASIVLWIGVGAYLVVGVLVVAAWFYRADVAPDALSTFGSSVLGWLAGAFAGVFKASTN